MASLSEAEKVLHRIYTTIGFPKELILLNSQDAYRNPSSSRFSSSERAVDSTDTAKATHLTRSIVTLGRGKQSPRGANDGKGMKPYFESEESLPNTSTDDTETPRKVGFSDLSALLRYTDCSNGSHM